MSAPGAALAIGVDVGGTFTDLAAIGADGTVATRKVPSTPADQSRGVDDALAALAADPATVARIAHGTTVVTNLLLERTGARVVLCATAGATDLLELRRQERAALYDLSRPHPDPLVPHGLTVGVRERMAPRGEVVTALDDAAVREAVAQVLACAPDIVAVCLLHGHESPAHEARLGAALRAARPDLDVVCAHEVLPEIREYERTATTVAEAYARPRVARYLDALEERLAARRLPAPLVVSSSGGMRPAREAARAAASLALSGPAGGVAGAAAVCAAAGITDALTIDIGGTSADVGVVLDGAPLVEAGGEVGGVPIALPRVLVETVSAGGGSIAWVDDGGALRVGPRSAGAVPGPACYGRGGTQPTVTDAHVVLGTVKARAFSGGVSLDADAARDALRPLAERLGADIGAVARAVIATADATMARALRRVSVERGLDPRQLVLVPFGGGGPLHACGLAEHLGMRRVFVPPHAGVLSALGLALAPERREALASVLARCDTLDAAAVRGVLDRLSEATAATVASGAPAMRRDWWWRVRFAGQGHELEVPVTPGDDGAAIADRFAALHRARFGFALDAPVDVVSARATATGAARPVAFARRGTGAWDPGDPRDTGGVLDVTVSGPASVALPDATLRVAPGWTARPLPIGGWMVEAP